ncbi:MAG: hypothetical protein JNK79_10455 [Chitinophagaceae bacterium]|nr:hypothetical protein [Chitinophagaceae bacterium]
MLRSLVAYIFFSNYFYGICALALAIEASLQQQIPLNPPFFYLFLFAVTVLYYTKAYLGEKRTGTGNPRTDWYGHNRNFVLASQAVFTIVAAVYLVILLVNHFNFIFHLPFTQWALMVTFPIVSLSYYGISDPRFAKFRLRNIGWLKPFIIGFVWAGLANIYPMMFYSIEHETVYVPDLVGLLLFIKNFMFVSVLSIMFDIKDYAADHNRQLKTFVVKSGLRKTIFFILIPLSALGLASFVTYGIIRQFSALKIALNVIPFLLLLQVAYSMHRRKTIFYYLIVIDGLMLVKGICGIIAMTFG